MRKTFILLLLSASLFISCQKEPLAFETKKFHKEIIHQKDTTTIEIEVALSSDKTAAADSINAVFLKEIGTLFSFDSTKQAKNFNEVCTSFIKEYQTFLKDEPEYTTPWEAAATGKVAYQSDNLINLTIDFYSFTGGAHGYGASHSYFIDASNGKQLQKEELFSDLKGFTKLAEREFRNEQQMPAKANINETGYWFEDDRFHLPNNIFYTDKGILLLYNQYEVASYADGPIELLIPYIDADKFLKIK